MQMIADEDEGGGVVKLSMVCGDHFGEINRCSKHAAVRLCETTAGGGNSQRRIKFAPGKKKFFAFASIGQVL